ncbi:growth inhibitor PemK [Maricaulis sp.]|uniref:growth inhibitor PemK n=1 Tax=Maricaulis sp. TaxID=1486257 RepID=UPI003A91F310
MPIANPAAGLVIGYHYLWKREADQGLEEGAKPRPVMVLATQASSTIVKVWVVPFTTQQPHDPGEAVAIPSAVLRMLGLGDGSSWAIASELNLFEWPGPDIAKLSAEADFALGRVPPALFIRIRQRVLAVHADGKLASVGRT